MQKINSFIRDDSDSIIAESKYNPAISQKYGKDVASIIAKYYSAVSDNAIENFIATGNLERLTAELLLSESGLTLDSMNKEFFYVATDFVTQIENGVDATLRNAFNKTNRPLPVILSALSKPLVVNKVTTDLINMQVNKIVDLFNYEYKKIDDIVQDAIVQHKNLNDVIKQIRATSIIAKGTARTKRKVIRNVERRIQLVAHNQLTFATSTFWKNKSEELGLYQHIWRHPPDSRYKTHPRPSHKKADGKQFDIRKGCYIDGEWIQPSDKINCECYSQIFIQ